VASVVLTKLDVLRSIPDTGGLDPEDGGSVRERLRANGARGVVALVWWWRAGNLVLLLTAFADALLAGQGNVGGLIRRPWRRW
jgi:hypothetical protein